MHVVHAYKSSICKGLAEALQAYKSSIWSPPVKSLLSEQIFLQIFAFDLVP